MFLGIAVAKCLSLFSTMITNENYVNLIIGVTGSISATLVIKLWDTFVNSIYAENELRFLLKELISFIEKQRGILSVEQYDYEITRQYLLICRVANNLCYVQEHERIVSEVSKAVINKSSDTKLILDGLESCLKSI